MQIVKKIGLFAIPLMLLSGCGSTEPNPVRIVNRTVIVKPTAFSTQQSETNLIESARSISHSLDQLAQIEKAIHHEVQLPPAPNPGSLGMANRASVDWTGPAEPLLRKIAFSSGYRLKVIGIEPPVPVIIAVQVNDVPVADILRDIVYQSAKKADIVVYPRSKVIELRYLR